MNNFTRKEKGYLFDLFRMCNKDGRIVYNNEYCKTIKDLSKAFNTSYKTLNKSLIPKLLEYDLIRESFDKDLNTTYLSLNPLLYDSIDEWNKWILISWIDIILSYNLMSKKQIESKIGKIVIHF